MRRTMSTGSGTLTLRYDESDILGLRSFSRITYSASPFMRSSSSGLFM